MKRNVFVMALALGALFVMKNGDGSESTKVDTGSNPVGFFECVETAGIIPPIVIPPRKRVECFQEEEMRFGQVS
ncbi:MAG: hypothetical protein LBT83_03775 [Tannerella sp.]|nr:hypothetical protein [Tannerella sp.]